MANRRNPLGLDTGPDQGPTSPDLSSPLVGPPTSPAPPTRGPNEGTPGTSTSVPSPPDKTAPGPDASSAPDPFAGLSPAFTSILKKYGKTPTGPGTGLTDSSYWDPKIASGDPYYADRLDKDFAGSGPDSPGASTDASSSGSNPAALMLMMSGLMGQGQSNQAPPSAYNDNILQQILSQVKH